MKRKKRRGATYRGRVFKNARGFAFVSLDTVTPPVEEDVFLDADEAHNLYSNDIIELEVIQPKRARPYGRVLRVLERGLANAVGEFKMGSYGPAVEIIGKGIDFTALVIPTKQVGAITPGSAVLVKLHYDNANATEPMAEVIKVVGSSLDFTTDDLYIISKHKLAKDFPKSVVDELKKIPTKVNLKEIKGRKDFRKLPFITIDGITAKDFDDAVLATWNENDSITLRIAVADVAHYVTPGTSLDKEAFSRGNSTYFPHTVIPMLPEKLSNGICSLNPKQDRLAMVCEIQVNPNGKIKSERFYNGVIHSHRRCTYEEIQDYLKNENSLRLSKPIKSNIKALYEAYTRLRNARIHRGTIDLDIAETIVEVNQTGKPVEIKKSDRLDSHRLIEECMIAANEAIARLTESCKARSIYRVHDHPESDAIEQFQSLAENLGVQFPSSNNSLNKRYQKFIATINNSKAKMPLSFLLLRSMKQAVYGAENLGHFALASTAYSHFTSPIRRYPDLIVHRILKHILSSKQKNKSIKSLQSDEDLDEIAKHCSARERISVDAEREMSRLKQVRFAKEHIGSEYTGFITGCNARGVFVELDEIYVEGFVEISRVSPDYHFDERGLKFYQHGSGKKICVGDRVRVLIANATPHLLRVDLEPLEIPLGITISNSNPKHMARGAHKPKQKTRRSKRKSDSARGPDAFLKRAEKDKKRSVKKK